MAGVDAVFVRKVLLVVGILAATILLLAAVYAASGVWLMAFAGILFSLLLQGAADRIRVWTHLPYAVALALICLAIPGLFGLFIVLVAPKIAAQTRQLGERIPQALEALYEQIRNLVGEDALQSNLPDPQQIIDTSLQSIGQLAGVFSSTMGAVVSVVIVVFVAIYLAISPALYFDATVRLFSPSKRPRIKEVMHALARALRWWLAGRFASMAVVGVLTATGLLLMGIPLAFTLGLLAAVLSFVPNIGPVVSAVPAVLLGLMESPVTGLYVIFLYAGIQAVESYLITPIIQKKAVSLPPALLIMVQLFFGVIAGIPGLFLATPIAVCVILLVQAFYLQDILGDDVEPLGETTG